VEIQATSPLLGEGRAVVRIASRFLTMDINDRALDSLALARADSLRAVGRRPLTFASRDTLDGYRDWQLGLGAISEGMGVDDFQDVAPERLTVHLGLALAIFAGLIWTALEAAFGEEASRSPVGWSRGAALLLGLVYLQCLLGGLVAGAKAGLIYTDWPLMNGQVLPPVDWSAGGMAFLHDHGLVQFNHRITAYVLFGAAIVYAVQAWRARLAEGLGAWAYALAGVVTLQAVLGIATLMHAVPIGLGVLHQAGAAVVLGVATTNLWMVRRSQPRLFRAGRRL
jgi:cytochrome c oxidase assembly protein subunit 15